MLSEDQEAVIIVIDASQTREMRKVACLFYFTGINEPPTVVRKAKRKVGLRFYHVAGSGGLSWCLCLPLSLGNLTPLVTFLTVGFCCRRLRAFHFLVPLRTLSGKSGAKLAHEYALFFTG